MAYLATSDWKKHLKLKEHSSVKKTGISEILEEFEKAEKKADNSGQVVALTKLREKIPEVKRKWSTLKTLTSYLDSMDREAKSEQDKIAKVLASFAEDDDLDGADSTLAAALEKLRKVSENNAHNFALAPGKPSTGLVVTRKSLKRDHIKQAMELRGKAGVYFTGTCFFDSGKCVFVFPEQPPRGMAKAIKMAARLHAEMNIKVIVRGGGVEFDDDTDAELDEAGEVASSTSGATSYPDAARFDPLIAQVRQLPAEKRADALSGLVGKINQLKRQAEGDDALATVQKQAVIAQLDIALSRVKAVVNEAGATRPGPTLYPTAQSWADLLDKCLQQPEDSRRQAVEALFRRIQDTIRQVAADPGLTDTTRPAEQKKLDDALKAIEARARDYMGQGATRQALDLVRRFRELQTAFDAIRQAKVLPPALLTDITRALDAARRALTQNEAAAAGAALTLADRKIAEARAYSATATAQGDRDAKQKRIHDSVKQGVDLFRKGAFAKGTADALFRDTGQVTMDKGLKKLGDDFRKCETDPSPANLSALSKDGQSYLAALAKAKAKLKPGRDDAKIAEIAAQEKLARQAVQRVRLLEMANEMNAIGTPPWDDAKHEKMAGLQAAFFFEEGAMKQGVADFGAPSLGGTDSKGVNDAWWIKRIDKDGEGGDATRTYIFKAQDREKTHFAGIPENGGVAREVLASKISDAMAGAGFDIGVCQTHIVAIDGAKLGGLSPEEGKERMTGAVQELAPSKGNWGTLAKSDPNAAQTPLNRRNVSDIAVFDMMFVNLDRHSNNFMLADAGNGENKLIPIDHGIGLPDPDGMALARFRFTGAQNSLTQDEAYPDDLLDEGTRRNLKAMNAKALTDSLRDQQRQTEARNPEIAGKIDPQEFDRMASRVQFMQVACDLLSANDLRWALGFYTRRINATAPDRMAQLAQDIKREIDANKKGYTDYLSFMKNPKSVQDLENLGWLVDISQSRQEEWIKKNGAFVARVLKARIPSPTALREVRELAEELKDQRGIEQINRMPLGKQLSHLRTMKRNKEKIVYREDESLNDDDKRAQKLVDDLSAGTTLEQIFALCPDEQPGDYNTNSSIVLLLQKWADIRKLGGEPVKKQIEAIFSEQRFGTVGDWLVALRAWPQFQALGGYRTLVDIDGWATTLEDAILMMREFAKGSSGKSEMERVMEIDEKRIFDAQMKQVAALEKDLRDAMGKLKAAANRARVADNVREVTRLRQAGEHTQAQGKLVLTLNDALSDLGTEARGTQIRTDQVQGIRTRMAQAAGDRPELAAGPLPGLIAAIAAPLAQCDFATVDGLIKQCEDILSPAQADT